VRVLVTGGTSMLGRAVADRRRARGDAVTLMQRSPSDSGFTEVLGDIAEDEVVLRATQHQDAVVHCAARVGVVGSADEFTRTNVRGTHVLVKAMEAQGVPRLVHVSSPSVAHAGHALMGVSAEPAAPNSARGHYARTKAEAERVVLTSGLPAVVAIRPHLVWGPGDTQLVGRIVDRARSGRLALVGRGTALIDTTYIDNAADALVAALDRADAISGEALVVSNGEPRTVAEMVSRILIAASLNPVNRRVPVALARGAGSVAEFVWAATSREDDPPMTRFLAEQLSTAHWFDQRHTRVVLDWSPAISLDEGFAELARWFRG